MAAAPHHAYDYGIATLAMLLVALVAVSPVACVVHQNEKVYQAIKAGADPISARCAFETNNSILCQNFNIKQVGTK